MGKKKVSCFFSDAEFSFTQDMGRYGCLPRKLDADEKLEVYILCESGFIQSSIALTGTKVICATLND